MIVYLPLGKFFSYQWKICFITLELQEEYMIVLIKISQAKLIGFFFIMTRSPFGSVCIVYRHCSGGP